MAKIKNMVITVILPSGRLSLEIMRTALELVEQYNLGVYFSTAQNLRLTEVRPEDADAIKAPLAALGARFKKPGIFQKPRICNGRKYCKMGLVDTQSLSDRLLELYWDVPTKPKLKIAIAGCKFNCSNPKLADIGIFATPKGLDVYVGGRGGGNPLVASCIATAISEDEVVEMVGTLLHYYNSTGEKKQRMFELMDRDDFPYTPL